MPAFKLVAQSVKATDGSLGDSVMRSPGGGVRAGGRGAAPRFAASIAPVAPSGGGADTASRPRRRDVRQSALGGDALPQSLHTLGRGSTRGLLALPSTFRSDAVGVILNRNGDGGEPRIDLGLFSRSPQIRSGHTPRLGRWSIALFATSVSSTLAIGLALGSLGAAAARIASTRAPRLIVQPSNSAAQFPNAIVMSFTRPRRVALPATPSN